MAGIEGGIAAWGGCWSTGLVTGVGGGQSPGGATASTIPEFMTCPGKEGAENSSCWEAGISSSVVSS